MWIAVVNENSLTSSVGFEPATSRIDHRRSNQLCYEVSLELVVGMKVSNSRQWGYSSTVEPKASSLVQRMRGLRGWEDEQHKIKKSGMEGRFVRSVLM